VAKHADGTLVGVECASTVKQKQLQKRLEKLHNCLPPGTYLIAVFPETLEKQAEKATQYTDEAGVTGQNGMFSSYLGKE
jgi:hypothetical protein